MGKLISLIEHLLIPVMAILSLLITLADFLSLLNALPWLSSRIPIITLLIVSLSLSSLAIMQSKSNEITNKVADIQQDVQAILSNKELEDMRKSFARIDQNLRKVFEQDILQQLDSFRLAVNESKFELTDMELFRHYYANTLKSFPRTTFLATSLPSSAYFWKNRSIEDEVAQFISKGGKMKRIFFIGGATELAATEVQEILTQQHNMGVEVYVADNTLIPNNLLVYFLVEAHGRIGWQAFIDETRRIRHVLATANPQETQRYCELFQRILHLSTTTRYQP